MPMNIITGNDLSNILMWPKYSAKRVELYLKNNNSQSLVSGKMHHPVQSANENFEGTKGHKL